MSYILEALEKSEQQRKQREVPNLQTQPAPYPGMSHTRWRKRTPVIRYLLPAAFVVIVVALSAWFFHDKLPLTFEIKITSKNNSPAEQPTVIEAQQPPSTNTTSQDSAATAPPAPASITTDKQAVTNNTDNGAPPLTATEEETQQTITSSNGSNTSQPEQGIINRTDVRLQPAPLMVTEHDDTEVISEVPLVPFLDELPAALRQKIPKLKFAGHTYSATPGDRLIIINNSIKREGDSVEPGLQLEEITWEGVILNFRGMRFQVTTTGI